MPLARAEADADEGPKSDTAGHKAVNVEEVLVALKHTCFVEHIFWKTCSASGVVDSVLKDYQSLVDTFCQMVKFVNATKKGKDPDVSASDLEHWCEHLPKKLPQWVGKDLSQMVQDNLLTVCNSRRQALASAGLAAVAKVVDQCVIPGGSLPTMTPEVQQELLLKIPKSQKVKTLVTQFLQATFDAVIIIFPSRQKI